VNLRSGSVLSVVETRGDWLQVRDSKGLTGWLYRDVVWPADYMQVSAQAVEQIPPQTPAEKEVAVIEQVQTKAIKEIQAEAVKKEVAEAAIPAKAEQAPAPTSTPAQPSKTTKAGEYASVAQVDGGANIRYEPSLSSEILRAVPPGFPVFILEGRGDWVQVEDFRERKGWVNASLLAEPGTVIIKVWKGNLRKGPSLTDTIITKLDYGTVLSVVKTRGDWLQVRDSERLTGWLHRDVLWPADYMAVSAQEVAATSEATPGQEVELPAQTVEPSPPQTPAEKEVAVAEQVLTEVVKEIQAEAVEKEEVAMPAKAEQATTPTKTFVQIAEATRPAEYASVTQNGSGANVHPEPSMSSEVLRALPPGYPVIVLERRGNWVLIEDFRKITGWVYTSLLSEPGTVIIKVWKGNVRSGPSFSDEIIDKLDYGTVISVMETRGDWVQVSSSERLTGWLHREVVWP